jgi:hypothetical protein
MEMLIILIWLLHVLSMYQIAIMYSMKMGNYVG